MTAREVKTSVRLTGDDADVFWALSSLFGERPHQTAARLVRENLALVMDDPELRPHLEVLFDVLARQRANEDARTTGNVVDLHTRRRL